METRPKLILWKVVKDNLAPPQKKNQIFIKKYDRPELSVKKNYRIRSPNVTSFVLFVLPIDCVF